MNTFVQRIALILLLAAVAAGIQEASAQSLVHSRYGFKLGYNHSTVVGEDVESGWDFRAAYRVGAFAIIPISERGAIVPELFYSRKGAIWEDGGESTTVNADIIEIPVTVNAFVPLGNSSILRLFGGFEMNLKVSARVIEEANGRTVEGDLKNTRSVGFGAVAGVGVDFRISRSNWLMFDIRGDAGLTSYVNESDVKDLTLALCMGISF